VIKTGRNTTNSVKNNMPSDYQHLITLRI